MDFHVLLRIRMHDDNWMTMGESINISWAIRDLIAASSGWSIINQESVGQAAFFVPKLKMGILELTQNPHSYMKYDIEHGLGTTKEVLNFYQNLLEECQQHPFTDVYSCIVS